MAEPCVIDIKIGRRTWDPLATEEKRIVESVSKFFLFSAFLLHLRKKCAIVITKLSVCIFILRELKAVTFYQGIFCEWIPHRFCW